MKKVLLQAALVLGCATLVQAQPFRLPSAHANPQAVATHPRAGFYGQALLHISSTNDPAQCIATNPCPSQLFISRTNGRLVRILTSNPVGQYYCILNPGEYIIRAKPFNKAVTSLAPAPFHITVVSNQLAPMNIAYGCVGSSTPEPNPIPEGPFPPLTWVDQNFKIALDSNPSTGYQWQLAQELDPALLQLVSTEFVQYPAPQPGTVGVPGKEIWTFKPLAAGQTEVKLQYLRTNETPLLTTNIPVTILSRN